MRSTRRADRRTPIVVHSHLRWDGVWQRPQQILSRLAERWRIAFVEEPQFSDRPSLAVREADGLVVVQPHVPPQGECLPRVSPANRQLIRELVGRWLEDSEFQGGVRWHYAPMALYLRGLCGSRAVVYDCMDELSGFKGAPPELKQQEQELIAEAHLLFTGGRSLWLSRRELHPNCHRFDSGVDVDHFLQAARPDLLPPPDARRLPRPVLGYYGVIDERMDYEAIRLLSAEFPRGTVLLVGPVTKVNPSELPRAENIVFTGQRPYSELPAYLKAFDVALVPFADNPATRFLSPTKTLEYFAGMKPVVSSPVRDVVENFSDIVWIARSASEYPAAVREALSGDHSDRLRRGLSLAREKSWEAIVRQMEALLLETLDGRQAPAAE